MKLYKGACTLFFVFIICVQVYAWETVKSSGGIMVSVQEVVDSDIKEFMAVTVTESSLSAILALLDDTAGYTRWNYRCSEAKLLHKKNDYERITYMVTTSPWPVAERDIAVRSVVSQNRKTGVVTVKLSGLPDYISVKGNRVRMASLSGYWKLVPIGKGKVRVIYRLHSDPGGSVPDSIVNSSLVDIPYNTLWNMRNFVKNEPYRSARYSDIIEK